MIEKHMSKTQLKLINTAGPLFAEDGLKGTRIRAITEAAGVNVAGINYHFGGKDKLYLAVVEFVFNRIDFTTFGSVWSRLPQEEHNMEGIAKMLSNNIASNFTKMFKSNHPIWYFKIVQKELSSPSELTRTKHDIKCSEDNKAVTEIFNILKPNAKKWEAEAWLVVWYAQCISLSILMPGGLNGCCENEQLPEEYVDAVTKNSLIAVTSILGISEYTLQDNSNV